MQRFGKYEVVRQIGAGGFGQVFEGYDPDIRRRVAIKTCLTGETEVRARFLREASIAGNLQHRNITVVFDLGEEEGTPYLVQEYLDGRDLDQLIESTSSIDLGRKLDYLAQLARGLGYAHSQGVIHRDIKPSNLRILDDHVLKIMDFGIAKSDRGDTSLTATGETVGTSIYLSPEQVKGQRTLDARCDIYSFGAVAFELLSGQALYRPMSPQRLIYRIVQDPAPDLAEVAPEVPARLAAIVRRCLQKERRLRFANCGELLMELNQINASELEPAAATSERLDRPRATTDTGAEERHPDSPVSSIRTPSDDELRDEDPEFDTADVPPSSDSGSRRAVGPEFDTAEVEPLTHRSQTSEPPSSGMLAAFKAVAEEDTHRRQRAQRWILLSLIGLIATSLLLLWWRRDGAAELPAVTVSSASADSTAVTASRQRPDAAPSTSQPTAAVESRGSIRLLPGWDPEIRVSIDGNNAMRLNEEQVIPVRAGAHLLEFSILLDDYQAFETVTVQVEDSQRLVLEPPLEEPGQLTFRAPVTSRELFVELDGTPLGWTPVVGRRVAPGQHTLTVASGPGAEQRTLSAHVRSGHLTTVIAGVDERSSVSVDQRPLPP